MTGQMMPLLDNFAYPEIILLITALVVLLADLFIKPRTTGMSLGLSAIGLIAAILSSILLVGSPKTLLFHGLYISDDVAHLMKIFINLSVLICFIYSASYLNEYQMPSSDYYVLGLFSTLGMLILVSAHSLLTVYLGLELLSLPLYALTAIQRSNSQAAEAAIKYFVMGGIASGMLLYGFSLVYGATGQIDLQGIANSLSFHQEKPLLLLAFALVFIMAGVGFKLAAVPFHMWAPDVYAGAPSSVTLLLSSAPKIAALGMLLRLLTIALPDIVNQWQQLLIVMTLLSTILGNLLAVVQTNLKRLFAYSAIAHMGYALFGVLAGSANGYGAALYYIVIYSLMTVATFGFVVLLSREGVELENVNDLRGLNQRNPWLAFMILLVMFSMAGVPPTVGFFTKLLVLKALVDSHMTWLAVLGLLFAVIGAYYYIRIVKIMYFDESYDQRPVQLSAGLNVVYSLNCLSLLALGIFPFTLIEACLKAFTS